MSTQTLVEHFHGGTSTSISSSSAFTVQVNAETTEASTVLNESTIDSGKIILVPENPWVPKYLLALGKPAKIVMSRLSLLTVIFQMAAASEVTSHSLFFVNL